MTFLNALLLSVTILGGIAIGFAIVIALWYLCEWLEQNHPVLHDIFCVIITIAVITVFICFITDLSLAWNLQYNIV